MLAAPQSLIRTVPDREMRSKQESTRVLEHRRTVAGGSPIQSKYCWEISLVASDITNQNLGSGSPQIVMASSQCLTMQSCNTRPQTLNNCQNRVSHVRATFTRVLRIKGGSFARRAQRCLGHTKTRAVGLEGSTAVGTSDEGKSSCLMIFYPCLGAANPSDAHIVYNHLAQCGRWTRWKNLRMDLMMARASARSK